MMMMMMMMILDCLKIGFFPTWEFSKEDNVDYLVHLYMSWHGIFRQTHTHTHIYIYITYEICIYIYNLEIVESDKQVHTHRGRKLFSSNDHLPKHIQHISVQWGNPESF